MILPWAHRLTQPGRTVCVVFRASPLIWPTPYLAHTTRPGPSTGAPPVVFHAGLWVLVAKSPFSPFAASFPMNGEAARPNCFRLPLPRLRGSSAEGSEGVFPLKTPLQQAVPPQERLFRSFP